MSLPLLFGKGSHEACLLLAAPTTNLARLPRIGLLRRRRRRRRLLLLPSTTLTFGLLVEIPGIA